jgi:hypothetical protein
VALLRELDELGVASPRLLAERLGESLGGVAYHVRTLSGWRVLELSETTARRGAVEHHYRLAPVARAVVRDMLALNLGAPQPPAHNDS